MSNGAWSNDNVTTLVIPTGATTGARVVIDGTTGLISVYNTSGTLVGQWGGANGCFFEYAGGVGAFVEVCGGEIQFGTTGFTPQANPTIIENGITVGGTSLLIDSGEVSGVNANSNLILFGGTGPAGAEIRATQRGINGDVLQLDTSNNVNQMVHIGAYNVTTDAGGSGTFNHNAAFTPMAGFLAGVNGIGANFPYQYAWFASPFTANTAKAAFKDNLGNALANTTVGVYGLFFG